MTVSPRRDMEPNGCGGARGSFDATLLNVGDVQVGSFVLPGGLDPSSVRADITVRGGAGARVRVRVVSSLSWPPEDAATPGPGVLVVDGAVTLLGVTGAWAVGAGPSWAPRYLAVAVSLEVAAAAGPVVSTVEINASAGPSAPFRTLGVGVTP